MLDSVFIEIYIKERLDSLNELLSKDDAAFTAADFHKARVETKKLNAISRLLAFSSKKFKRESFIRKYKELFAIAGAIRETQLELAFVEENHLMEPMPGFIAIQTKNIEKNRRLFCKKSGWLKKKIEKDFSKLQVAGRQVNRWKMFQYRTLLVSQLFLLLYKAPHEPEGMHNLRKKLKEVLYMLHVFNTNNSAKQIDAFQDLIGKWHDRMVMAEKLAAKKWQRKLPEAEISTLAVMQNKLSTAAATFKKKIIADIEKYLNGKPLLPPQMYLANNKIH